MPGFNKNAPATQRQQLVEVKPFDGYFATKSGGEVSADPAKVYDGGKKRPEILSAVSETDNITVSRPYRPAVHANLLRQLQRQVGSYATVVTVYDTDPDLGRISPPQNVYAPAVLVRLAWPEHDASSADAGMFELEFMVDAS